MLHVFAVNKGHLLTFDVNLAMEKVVKLKSAIENKCLVASDKQVLLVKGGKAVEDRGKVCEYAAGTESNPFFMFDMSAVESALLTRCPTPKLTDEFITEVRSSARLPPTYSSMLQRTKLAIRIKEATLNQVSSLKSLIRDEQLMFEGWQAAFSNLEIVLSHFKQRAASLHKECLKIFQEAKLSESILEGFDDVIALLKRVPLLESLPGGKEKSLDSCCSLLDWIEAKYRGPKLRDLVTACKQQTVMLNREKLSNLIDEIKRVSETARNSAIRDDSRTKGILSAQNEVLVAAEREVAFQVSLAQGFVKNHENARELTENSLNSDAMMTLCESHVSQLNKMHEVEQGTREGFKKCSQQKNYLIKTFHTGLMWIYGVQQNIAKCDRELSIFNDRLVQFQQNLGFLAAVRNAPRAYIFFLVESARRPVFAKAFTEWADGVVSVTSVAREREVSKRRLFKKNRSRHFLATLFPGLGDKPPAVAKRSMRKFDVDIPAVTRDDIISVVESAPELKEFYDEADLNGFNFPWEQLDPALGKLSGDPNAAVELSMEKSTMRSVLLQRYEKLLARSSVNIISGTPSDENNSSMGEFFTISPLPLSETHSFIPISPPSRSARSMDKPTRSHISSDEEMFHSIDNDVKFDILSQFEEEIKKKNEELLKIKRKYKEKISRMEQEREEVLLGRDKELLNMMNQLEREREERRRAWESESETAKKLKKLEEDFSNVTEENKQLRMELSLKNEQMTELRGDVARQKEDCTVKIASEEERLATENWKLQEEFDLEKNKWRIAKAKLEKEAQICSDELASCEDHVQELEKQLSEAENAMSTLNVTIATCNAEVEICQNEVADCKAKMKDAEAQKSNAENRMIVAEEELQKMSEKMTGLKKIMADYEMQLQDSEEKAKELKELKAEASELQSEKSRLEELVRDTNQAQRELESQVMELNEEAARYKLLLSENEEGVQRKLDELREIHEKEILAVKQDSEESRKKMFESNKKKMEDVLSDHQEEIERLKDDHHWDLEGIKKSHSVLMDELRVDHLDDMCRVQADVTRLQDELRRESETSSKLHDQLLGSVRDAAVDMTSSSGESSSKIARLDDAMITSVKEEVEKEKQALALSMRKREEAATKRRQIMFNSAIQRLACSKDAEISRLKEKLSSSQMNHSTITLSQDSTMSSSVRSKEREFVFTSNFRPDDRVLVTFDARHNYPVLLTLSKTLHFVHTDSHQKLQAEDFRETSFLPALVVSKQYCMAKKGSNRFGVPVDTKFYRVKVTLFPT